MTALSSRVAQICEIIRDSETAVTIGFSGGKDSSAVVKLLWACALHLGAKCPPLRVVYCDTEVENPVIDQHVKTTLRNLETEAKETGVVLASVVINPELHRGFFVRIIGRGYPTPTNSFRWCTKDIRIRPFQTYLAGGNSQSLIAIGTRYGESAQRDRSLKKHNDEPENGKFIQRQREGSSETRLLTPIIDFDTADVWELLCEFEQPSAIDVDTLARLYKDGSGECPAIRDFKDKPCSKARFGCWTCTVVRRDRSAEHMINSGYDQLLPYFEFRNWISEFRNDSQNRCSQRRNGSDGLGPFTIAARHEIFDRLVNLEKKVGRKILSDAQVIQIKSLIATDLDDDRYIETDHSVRGKCSFPLFDI